MKNNFYFFVLLGSLLIPFVTYATAAAPIVIGNNHFQYEIAADGRNLHFRDKMNGVDYLKVTEKSYCASVIRDGKEIRVSSAVLNGNLLRMGFMQDAVTVDILISKRSDHIEWEVIAVKGEVESLTFFNVPLTLHGLPDEPFAACALSMNGFTKVQQLPPLQTHLRASCFRRFGIKGAKITLLGVPQKVVLPVIREIMTNAKDVPRSTAGGAWAELSKEGYGSYLMDFGSLTEETVDEWIEKCRSIGFNQIDHQGGTPDFFSFGSFELNPKKWPEGWTNFKRINKRLHDAGITSIFHTYAFFIDKESRYVKPVPSPDLAYFNAFTLAAPMGASDSVIEVRESTEKISEITGFFIQNSRTLRIDGELIEFSGAAKVPPYRFTGCKRAANGTKASAHPVETKAFHLKEEFGRFLPGPETPLFEEIAQNTADIVNGSDFDGIYFDAIDGSSILDAGEGAWYYSTKFVFEVARRLNHPVGIEFSDMMHSWWHYRSRWQAWDTPRRGFKRFVDIHCASIKTNEYEAWRGDTSVINRLASLEKGGMLLPLQLGWWLNFTWEPPQTETTFTDDIEYLGCKMIGNNAGLALIGGVEKKEVDENPAFIRLNALIRQYETLRQKNYFGEHVRKLLRQAGKEFTLFQEKDSSWNFKPVAFQRHKVAATNHPSARWTVDNTFASQPVRLRIESLLSVASYTDSNTKVLADFSGVVNSGAVNFRAVNSGVVKSDCGHSGFAGFSKVDTAAGVTGGIYPSVEKTISGEPAGIFTAASSGISPRNGSWISMEKKFGPWLDIGKQQGLGVWIKGDGQGELLNFRLGGPLQYSYGARGDHFVKIDFTGWRYVELVEVESAEFSNYLWPGAGNIYNSYLNSVDFTHVDKLQVWYNNLPAGKTVSCLIGPVKAIPTVAGVLENPSVTIGGEKIVFPVRMESGMYLEFQSFSDCRLYGSKGQLLKEVTPIGKAPDFVKGKNEVSFKCDGKGNVNPRVQVTIIGEGMPLKK